MEQIKEIQEIGDHLMWLMLYAMAGFALLGLGMALFRKYLIGIYSITVSAMTAAAIWLIHTHPEYIIPATIAAIAFILTCLGHGKGLKY